METAAVPGDGPVIAVTSVPSSGVGSSGETPLKGAILGSTAHKLLHMSNRPVLVVPAER